MDAAAAVVAGDVRLGYTVGGHGEPVVLVHAGVLADWFRPLLQQPILTNRYQLIVYHRANYGTSEHDCAHFSVPEQAEQCRQLLRHLRITRAHIVGHSAGAAIALQLAHDAPWLVQSLTVMDPALNPGAATRAGAPPFLLELLDRHASGDTAGAVDGFMRAVCGDHWQGVVARMLPPEALSQALTDADGLFRQEIPALLAWRFSEEQARRVICPTLVVAGAESPPVFAQRQHLLLEWLPRADAFTLPGAGHLLHLEQPERFAVALASFLARHRMPAMHGAPRA